MASGAFFVELVSLAVGFGDSWGVGDGGGCDWILETAGHIRVGGGAQRAEDIPMGHNTLMSIFGGRKRR